MVPHLQWFSLRLLDSMMVQKYTHLVKSRLQILIFYVFLCWCCVVGYSGDPGTREPGVSVAPIGYMIIEPMATLQCAVCQAWCLRGWVY